MRKDEGTLVHKIKNDYGFHQYVKQKTINNTENYEFTIKIVKSENKKIMVGIVLKDRKNQVSSYSSGEAIVYSGFQGMIIFGEEKKKQMGNGFYEGSKVTVIVKVK